MTSERSVDVEQSKKNYGGSKRDAKLTYATTVFSWITAIVSLIKTIRVTAAAIEGSPPPVAT